MNGRLKQFIKASNLSLRAFEKSIDVSNGVIRRFIDEETSIKSETIIRILTTYPDLSAEWLLRGNGEMLLSKQQAKDNSATLLIRRLEELTIENHTLRASQNDKRQTTKNRASPKTHGRKKDETRSLPICQL